jgi:ectoine hydroxylase-related dioxygenase (phytanoyl-CoA dioxygenase family)
MKAAEFINQDLQSQYEENGYAIVKNVLDSSEIEQLKSLFASHYYHNEPYTMWNSICDTPHDRAPLVSNQIINIVKPNLDKVFKNYVCPVGTFLVKNPSPTSTVRLHRDFSIQDEAEFSYQNIWIPLVDTTPENGQLFVLKKSHKFFNYPLPHNAPWPYIEHEKLLLAHCDIIDAKAGDLVIYNDKMLHGSSDNLTDKPRPVVHFGLLHPDAKILYYYLNEQSKEVTTYETPSSFFFEIAQKGGNQDGRFPVYKKFNYSPPSINEADVSSWLSKNFRETA